MAPAAAALALLFLPHLVDAATYTKISAKEVCRDYLIPDVTSKDECFNTAEASAGVSSTLKLELNGVGFSGCVLNSKTNILMYGETPDMSAEKNIKLPSYEYICNGIPTTTVTMTTTASTGTSTTVTSRFAILGGNSRCSDEGVPDIMTQQDCAESMEALGLHNTALTVLNNMAFSGCVFNSEGPSVLFGLSDGLSVKENIKRDSFEYLCAGIPTTTTTITLTGTTSTRTSTSSTMTTRTSSTTSTLTITYSKVPDKTCASESLLDIADSEACFGPAAAASGLAGVEKVVIDGIGFSGCVYNRLAGMLMYGVTENVEHSQNLLLPGFEYICVGHLGVLIP